MSTMLQEKDHGVIKDIVESICLNIEKKKICVTNLELVSLCWVGSCLLHGFILLQSSPLCYLLTSLVTTLPHMVLQVWTWNLAISSFCLLLLFPLLFSKSFAQVDVQFERILFILTNFLWHLGSVELFFFFWIDIFVFALI